jgi:hypothetical protein
MLKGRICASQSDKEFLESLGIILGEYDEMCMDFNNCLVTDEAFEKLEPYWGVYYWSLEFE